MQIVAINISDADYKSITEDYISYANTESGRVYKAIKEGTVLPDNPTNGDALFSSGLFERVKEHDDGVFAYVKCKGAPLQILEISKDWLNSPYKGEQDADNN